MLSKFRYNSSFWTQNSAPKLNFFVAPHFPAVPFPSHYQLFMTGPRGSGTKREPSLMCPLVSVDEDASIRGSNDTPICNLLEFRRNCCFHLQVLSYRRHTWLPSVKAASPYEKHFIILPYLRSNPEVGTFRHHQFRPVFRGGYKYSWNRASNVTSCKNNLLTNSAATYNKNNKKTKDKNKKDENNKNKR